MISVKSQTSLKRNEWACTSKRPFSQFFTPLSSHPAESQLTSVFLMSRKDSAPPGDRVPKKSWNSIKNLEMLTLKTALVSYNKHYLKFQVDVRLFWAFCLGFHAESLKWKESGSEEIGDSDASLVLMLSHSTEKKTDCVLWAEIGSWISSHHHAVQGKSFIDYYNDGQTNRGNFCLTHLLLFYTFPSQLFSTSFSELMCWCFRIPGHMVTHMGKCPTQWMEPHCKD